MAKMEVLKAGEPSPEEQVSQEDGCRHCWSAWTSVEKRIRFDNGFETAGYWLMRFCSRCARKEFA